jgi:UDP-N-acetylmuramate--alanine ligase
MQQKIQLPKRGRRIHFIGIGGAGMSGIAEVMHGIGYAVSGSDLQQGAMTQRLANAGIKVQIGHNAENVHGCDVVVVSTAVKQNNPEVQEARKLHIPVIPRAEMLGELMRFRQGMAIAGTHGKTTTTSLIASILAEGQLDPTFVIGGKLNSLGTHASLGSGHYLVAEADESDASFLYLKPIMAVVTNIDADHMETYEHDFSKLVQTFENFLHQLPFYGLAILCIDDPVIRQQILPVITKPVLTYGFSEDADIRAIDIHQQQGQTRFKVLRGQIHSLDVTLNLPGLHNVLNALAAIAIAQEVGVSEQAIRSALQSFSGIGRRFQTQNIHLPQGDILLIDDYGHHPREIEAVFNAIHDGWSERRLIVIFQPHRYSRTRDLFNEFIDVLSQADMLFLLDVYSAGEAHIEGADGQALANAIAKNGQNPPIFIEQHEQLLEQLLPQLQNNDIVLTLGAGNIGAISTHLSDKLAAMQAN